MRRRAVHAQKSRNKSKRYRAKKKNRVKRKKLKSPHGAKMAAQRG